MLEKRKEGLLSILKEVESGSITPIEEIGEALGYPLYFIPEIFLNNIFRTKNECIDRILEVVRVKYPKLGKGSRLEISSPTFKKVNY